MPCLLLAAPGVPLPVILGVAGFGAFVAILCLVGGLLSLARAKRMAAIPQVDPSRLSLDWVGRQVRVRGKASGSVHPSPASAKPCVAWVQWTMSVSQNPDTPTQSYGHAFSPGDWGLSDGRGSVLVRWSKEHLNITLGTSSQQNGKGWSDGSYAASEVHCEAVIAEGDALDASGVIESGPHGLALSLHHPDSALTRAGVDAAQAARKEGRLLLACAAGAVLLFGAVAALMRWG
jgi:hypothetical protein